MLIALALAASLPLAAHADASPECNDGFHDASTECGRNSFTNGDATSAFGWSAAANGLRATALGALSGAFQQDGTAIGAFSRVNTGGGGSLPLLAVPTLIGGTAVGAFARTQGDNNVAIGGFAVVGERGQFTRVDDGTALGAGSLVSANGGAAVGHRTTVSAIDGAALGNGATVSGASSVALGANASATAANSVALGAGTVADEADTVAVGNRRITGVADARTDADAVNLGQLGAVAEALGGGAGFAGGTFTAPSYTIQGASHASVGGALGALDTAVSSVLASAVSEQRVDDGDATTLASAQTYTDTRESAVRTDMAAGDAQTLVDANAYADAGDASTRTYADTTATRSLDNARSYTDSVFAALNADVDGLRSEVDTRFAHQDRRIDRQGSMGSAMLNMAINAGGAGPRGRIAAGVGFQGGERALAIGYGKRIGRTASFSLGGAFSGSEKTAGVGFGVDL